jgi:hypothetical protein
MPYVKSNSSFSLLFLHRDRRLLDIVYVLNFVTALQQVPVPLIFVMNVVECVDRIGVWNKRVLPLRIPCNLHFLCE